MAVAQSSSNRLMSAGTNHLKTDFANSTTNVVKNAFRACCISISQCGGQDKEVSVFKAGCECEAGLEMLKAAAAEEEQEFEEDPNEEEHFWLTSKTRMTKLSSKMTATFRKIKLFSDQKCIAFTIVAVIKKN